MGTDPNTRQVDTAESAFRSLFDDHFADIWRFARRRCDSPQDADDVTAETFAIAWRRRDDVPPADTRLWLFGVARRVIANHRRAAERRDRLRVRLAETWQEDIPIYGGGGSGQAVREALGALSAGDRDILLMQAWDELSVGEIAVILDCSPNAASLRLYKARRRLALELQRKDETAPGHVAGGSLSTEGGLP